MKSITLFLILIVTLSISQTQQEILTNYTVLSLIKKGFSNSVILSKIKQANCNFDVSTEALSFLKDNKVSDDIITAMIDKSAVQPTVPTNQPKNITQNTQSVSIDQRSPQAEKIISNLDGSGIYYFDATRNQYIKVDPTVISGVENRANGMLAATPVTTKSFIDGKEANIQLTDSHPVFYFFFDHASTSLNNSNNKTGQAKDNYMEVLIGSNILNKNSKAFSPNDFKLLELDIQKHSRYFKSGLSGITSRISSSYFIDFKYDKISSDLYKVYPKTELNKSGEFCFIYAGNSSNNDISYQQQNREVKVFDFGTNLGNKKK